MSDPGHDPVPRRDWKLIGAAVLALALLIGVIAYKYTGDFTGVVKFGTSGQPRRNYPEDFGGMYRKSGVYIRTKHAAAQAWLLLWRRGIATGRATLAPLSDGDRRDYFRVRARDELSAAISPHSFPTVAQNSNFLRYSEADTIRV